MATLTGTWVLLLLVLNVFLLFVGLAMEMIASMVILVPLLVPILKAANIDLVHFGVITVFNIMIGLITPPYGLLLFIISAISGAPLRHIIRDTMPFVYAMIVALAIITYFPETVLWLPKMFFFFMPSHRPMATWMDSTLPSAPLVTSTTWPTFLSSEL